MTFDHAQSPRLGQPTAVENPGVQLVTVTTLPEIARRGQIVYCLDIDEFRVNDGVAWQNPANSGGTNVAGTQTFIGPTAPAADHVGDLWMNTTSYQLYVWDGTAWKPNVDPVAQAAALAASTAQVTAENALGLAQHAGKTTIWYLPTQPVQPDQAVVIGDYWINTVTNKLYVFDTLTSVVEVQDQDIASALNQAGTAQATADQKIVSYTLLWANRPLDLGPMGIGDILFAVDQGNATYRWDGADWVALATSTVSSVTITDGFSLSSGSTGHIEVASSLTMDGSTTSPSTAPVYYQWYLYNSFQINNYFNPGYAVASATLGGFEFDGTSVWVCVNQYNTARNRCLGALYQFDYATGAQLGKWNYSVSNQYELIDVTMVGNSIHLAMHNLVNGAWWMQRVNKTTMAMDASIARNTASNAPIIGIDCDASNVWLARQSGNQLMELTRYDPNYNATSASNSYTNTNTITSWNWGCAVSPTGFPGTAAAPRLTVAITFDNSPVAIQSLSYSGTAMSTITNESFESQYSGAISWDGANFRQIYKSIGADNKFGMRQFSNDMSTTKRWVSADYRSVHTVTGATLYRTTPSSKVSYTPKRRAYLQVTAPPIPPDLNPGTEGDVNAVGIYIGQGTSEPVNTAMWLQTPELGINARTFDVPSSGPTYSGAHPLTTGTFPTSSPGHVKSANLRVDGLPVNYIDGAGGARIDGLMPPGTMAIYAGAAAPTGWLQCNGASLSTTTYPDLFAAIGYRFGGSSTSFSLPNLNPGTSLMYIIRT